nr:dihydropteroate synthase [Novipirellula aureliae]
MGIVNVTPDSFSDGGKHFASDEAIRSALQMQADGADIVDIGGESTRPYSDPVDTAEELRRVLPVIQGLAGKLTIPISIDTSKAEVARQAIAAGAEIVNDITGLHGDPGMLNVVREAGVGVCVMHIQGTPQTMQDNPTYNDVVAEIEAYLIATRTMCESAGIDRDRICLDPGIGFGKSHEHNLQLLRATERFASLGSPLLIGHSRKGFIGKVLADKMADRDAAGIGISLAVAAAGASVVRVHAVGPTAQALKLFQSCRDV